MINSPIGRVRHSRRDNRTSYKTNHAPEQPTNRTPNLPAYNSSVMTTGVAVRQRVGVGVGVPVR